jgi:hypothetical protein
MNEGERDKDEKNKRVVRSSHDEYNCSLKYTEKTQTMMKTPVYAEVLISGE